MGLLVWLTAIAMSSIVLLLKISSSRNQRCVVGSKEGLGVTQNGAARRLEQRRGGNRSRQRGVGGCGEELQNVVVDFGGDVVVNAQPLIRRFEIEAIEADVVGFADADEALDARERWAKRVCAEDVRIRLGDPWQHIEGSLAWRRGQAAIRQEMDRLLDQRHILLRFQRLLMGLAGLQFGNRDHPYQCGSEARGRHV